MNKTKKELLEEADEKGVEVSDKMTKSEIEDALTEGSSEEEDQSSEKQTDSEASFQKTAQTTADVINAMPKVKVFVPLEGDEKKGAQLPVNINGHRWNVPKGVSVEVPEPVAEVISQSLNVYTDNSATEMLVDSDRQKEGVRVEDVLS